MVTSDGFGNWCTNINLIDMACGSGKDIQIRFKDGSIFTGQIERQMKPKFLWFQEEYQYYFYDKHFRKLTEIDINDVAEWRRLD